MATRPSLAFFGDDLTGAAEPGSAPWARGPATPVTPPAGILPDPNVVWLDPGLLMEPGTGFGSAQKTDILGQAMDDAQQFLEAPRGGGGGAGGGGPDLLNIARDAVRGMTGPAQQPQGASPQAFGAPSSTAVGGGPLGFAADTIGVGEPVPTIGGVPTSLTEGGRAWAGSPISGGEFGPGPSGAIGDMTVSEAQQLAELIGADPASRLAQLAGAGSAVGAFSTPSGQLTTSAPEILRGVQYATPSMSSQALDLISKWANPYGLSGAGAGVAALPIAFMALASADPSARPKSEFYTPSEQTMSQIGQIAGAALAPLTLGFSQPLMAALENIFGFGKKGAARAARYEQAGGVMDALQRALAGISPENFESVMGRELYRSPVDYARGKFTIPGSPAIQSFSEGMGDIAATPDIEVGFDDPRFRAQVPSYGTTVGSLLSGVAARTGAAAPRIGTYSPAYEINAGRIGSVPELLAYAGGNQGDLSQWMDMIAALEQLGGA